MVSQSTCVLPSGRNHQAYVEAAANAADEPTVNHVRLAAKWLIVDMGDDS
jgi:hypothetical protein